MSQSLDIISSMDRVLETFLGKLRKWAVKAGKYGKHGYQSLLAHSVSVMEVAGNILEYLVKNEIISTPDPREVDIMLIGALFHDVAKEDWDISQYVRDRSFKQKDPGILKKKLQSYLKGTKYISDIDDILYIIMQCEEYESADHMFSTAISNIDPALVDSVIIADRLCSQKPPEEFNLKGVQNVLKRYGLHVAYHSVSIIRGVSTQLLHTAVENAYKKKGYSPVLYLPTITIYVGTENMNEPTRDDILGSLVEELKDYFASASSSQVVSLVKGPINQKPILVPEMLFGYEKIMSEFWNEVFSANKNYKDIISQAGMYLNAIAGLLGEEYRERISRSISNRLNIPFEKVKQYTLLRNTLAKSKKEVILDDFMSCLTGSEEKILEDLKDAILEAIKGISSDAKAMYPLEGYFKKQAEILLADLIVPGGVSTDMAEEIYNTYLTPRTTFKEGKKYICSVCGNIATRPPDAGITGPGAKAFSPHLPGGKNIEKGWVCDVCYLEGVLRKIKMGDVPTDIMYIFPQISMSARAADFLVASAEKIASIVSNIGELGRNIMEKGFSTFMDKIGFRKLEVRDFLEKRIERVEKEIKKVIENWKKEFEEYINDLDISREIPPELLGNNAGKVALDMYLNNTWPLPRNENARMLIDILKDRVDGIVHKKGLVRVWPYVNCRNFIVTTLSIKKGEEPECVTAIKNTFLGAFLGLKLQVSVIFSSANSILLPPVPHGYVKVPENITARIYLRNLGLLENLQAGIEYREWIADKVIDTIKKIGAALYISQYVRERLGFTRQLYGRSTLLDLLSRNPGMILLRIENTISLAAEQRKIIMDCLDIIHK